MDINKLYTGDYSKEGYEDGMSSAENDKPKSKLSIFRAVNPTNYVWQYDNAFESYTRSFDKGYDDGLRKKNEVHYPNSDTGGTGNAKLGGNLMAGGYSYDHQVNLLEEFQRHLRTLKTYLQQSNEAYEQQINKAAELGFYDDYVDGLKKRQAAFSQNVNQVIELIDRQYDKSETDHKDEIVRLRQEAQK